MRGRRAFVAVLGIAATLIVGSAAPTVAAPARSAAVSSNPLQPGPHHVAVKHYSLGDTAYRIPGFLGPIELTGEVFYPTDFSGAPYPIVVLLHGRHQTCMSSREATGDWPCKKGYKAIPSYRGYDYLAKPLASHGYVVISISANGINAADWQSDDSGMTARGQLILKHLDLWHGWYANPKGSPIPWPNVRAFDFNRIGLMGHSRGGEGIVAALEQNATRADPYQIKALLPLAPTDFDRRIPINVPTGTLLPTCDGDVSDLEGVHYYDDARYRVPTDTGPKNVITVQGANHNYFNTSWSPSSKFPGAIDDWTFDGGTKKSACSPTKPTRLTETQQRRAGSGYIGSFFRYYLGGETAFAPLWHGDAGVPQSIAPAKVSVTYEAPSVKGRLDINRFDGYGDSNYLGGAVRVHGQSDVSGCGGADSDKYASCLSRQQSDAQREPERGWGFQGVSAATVTWRKPSDSIANDIPTRYGDLRKYRAVELRTGLDFTSKLNAAGKPQDFRITLTDRHGKSASVRLSRFSAALNYPLTAPDFDVVPHLLFNPARVPLAAFHGIDLARIRTVTLAFNATHQGRVVLTDLAFSN